jgi:acyl-coenzyme A thioesterase PaaI-like protein
MVTASIIDIIRRRLGERVDRYRVPPPIFEAMQGEFLAYDVEAGTLTTRFPVLDHYLNPYGAMQGGMVAAAIDNTLGPLSMLVAPPNVTRRLQIKYSRPVTPGLGYILVKGRFLERDGRWLRFKADVRDEGGALLARARATHWIVDED